MKSVMSFALSKGISDLSVNLPSSWGYDILFADVINNKIKDIERAPIRFNTNIQYLNIIYKWARPEVLRKVERRTS